MALKKAIVASQIFSLMSFLSLLASSSQPAPLTLWVSGEELGYLEPCGCGDGQLGGFPRRDNLLKQLETKRKTRIGTRPKATLAIEDRLSSHWRCWQIFSALSDRRLPALSRRADESQQHRPAKGLFEKARCRAGRSTSPLRREMIETILFPTRRTKRAGARSP